MRDHVQPFLDSRVRSRYYGGMRNDGNSEFERLRTLLLDEQRFAGQVRDIQPCWQRCDWSEVYCLHMDDDGTHLFLKGVPRTRNEVKVTQWLSILYPASIPNIIVADLDPEARWQWFVMEDAGETNTEDLPPPLALQAAFTLGALQCRATKDSFVLPCLIQCRGDHLQRRVLDVCAWVLEQRLDAAARSHIARITADLSQASDFFGEVAAHLAIVPPTIVHGDFWAGNIANADGQIRLIDWGDVLWGVGGVPIINLLLSSRGMLEEAAPAIWDAYERGWGLHLTGRYHEACAVAHAVSNLVIDREIARCSAHGWEILPGLLPDLCALHEQVLEQEARAGNVPHSLPIL